MRIILSGCHGAMGKAIYHSAIQQEGIEIVAGIDHANSAPLSFPVYTNFSQIMEQGDLVIDFSHPDCLDSLLAFCLGQRLPLVLATTGFTQEQREKILSASKQIPLFFTANMSLGVNLLCVLAKQAATILGTDFDIEIVEKHHNNKVDSPSGTALLLAEEISSVLPTPPHPVYDRHTKREKRSKEEIGIHSIRGGTIVGDHDVLFAGTDEVITLSHHASSKAVFANGAIRAALFLKQQPAGLYNMGDLLSQR